MPSVIQYRQRAKQFLDLAKESRESYAKETLCELAEEFNKAAEELERDQRLTHSSRREH
jgi:hypothetical protein